ncbi:MAG: MarR family winged helix-turn-helix transcriptional regulator [Pseudomonadota bacterium]
MRTDSEIDALFGLLRAVKRAYHAEIQRLGIDLAPMHLKVLRMVKHRSGCTAQDMAAAFGRDKAQIARLVQSLLQMGYVRRVANPNDGRSQLIELDSAGEDVLTKTASIHKRVVALMTDGVGKKDQAAFFATARQFQENLARRPSRSR